MTTHTASRGLAARLAANVDAAFPALVDAHVDRLFSGVRRLAPSHADAEELTQDTLIRAYRALRSYDADRIATLQLRPWLWTIALNVCRSAARRRSRRVVEVALDGAAASPSPDQPDADAVAVVMEGAWNERLSALSPAQRTAVVLRHVTDLPYTEIAAITGRPLGTVKADVHRGIERLRTILAAEHAGDQETHP